MTIDSLDQLDLQKLQYKDLKARYGTGRAYSEGSGRNKKSWYRTGVMTKIGDIRLDVWIQAAQALIAKNDDEDLLSAVMEYRENDYSIPMHKDTKLVECLKDVLSRLVDNPEWIGFVPFNSKYRPELMKQVEIVKIFPACCNKWCDIPEAQILSSYDGRVHCPLCGAYTDYLTKKADSAAVF